MKELTIQQIADRMGGVILQGDASLPIREYSFSSKEGDEATLFLPMVGERVDAHNFLADAAVRMKATVTERGEVSELAPELTYIAVESTLAAWQRLGASFRSDYEQIPMVAITGSVGKTTTKEMVATAIGSELSVLKTIGNQNGQLGVPRMMGHLDSSVQCAVIEMGMSLPGEMRRIAEVAMPNVVIVTNIGVSHIGNLKTQENIRKEKLCIINRIQKPACLFLNGNDPLLAELCPTSPSHRPVEEIELYPETREALAGVTIYSYGTKEWCDFRATNIELEGKLTHFTYRRQQMELLVSLPVPGMHNVLNAVAAIAAAYIVGVRGTMAVRGLAAYEPMAMRGNPEKLSQGIWLIDDTYNASPDSMNSGLAVMEGIDTGGRKIAVLADILELGERSEQCHRMVGSFVAGHHTDICITVGEAARFIAEQAKLEAPAMTVMVCQTREEAMEQLTGCLRRDDVVLLKGSRGMGLDVLARQVRELWNTQM